MAKRKSSTQTKTTKSSVTLNLLRQTMMLSTGVYIALAIAAGILMSRITYKITVAYQAKDELLSQTSHVLSPANHVLYEMEIRYLLVALLLVSAVLTVLTLTRWQSHYKKSLDSGTVLIRWLDYGISGALIIEILAILSGVSDLMTLKILGGLIVISSVLNYLSEKRNEKAAKQARSEYYLSLITASMAWLVVASAAIHTYIYGMSRSPGYVYGLYAVGLFGFVSVAINRFNNLRQHKSWADNKVTELNYLTISLFTKVVFAAALIIGLKR